MGIGRAALISICLLLNLFKQLPFDKEKCRFRIQRSVNGDKVSRLPEQSDRTVEIRRSMASVSSIGRILTSEADHSML